MLDAMRLGSAMRTLDAHTVVGRAYLKRGVVEVAPGSCYSACVTAFVGGQRRAVPAGSVLGVHAWMPSFLVDPSVKKPKDYPQTLDRKALEYVHRSTARYMRHFDEMGIDLRVWVKTLYTSYDRMANLTAEEMRTLRVTTEATALQKAPDRPRPILVLPSPDRRPAARPAEGASAEPKSAGSPAASLPTSAARPAGSATAQVEGQSTDPAREAKPGASPAAGPKPSVKRAEASRSARKRPR
jgi:hypothetical protein